MPVWSVDCGRTCRRTVPGRTEVPGSNDAPSVDTVPETGATSWTTRPGASRQVPASGKPWYTVSGPATPSPKGIAQAASFDKTTSASGTSACRARSASP